METLSGIRSIKLIKQGGEVQCRPGGYGESGAEGRCYSGKELNGIPSSTCRLSSAGEEYRITCVSMGNPHCVVFCDNVDSSGSGASRAGL